MDSKSNANKNTFKKIPTTTKISNQIPLIFPFLFAYKIIVRLVSISYDLAFYITFNSSIHFFKCFSKSGFFF